MNIPVEPVEEGRLDASRPLDLKYGILPKDAVLMLMGAVIRAFVNESNLIAKGDKAVSNPS